MLVLDVPKYVFYDHSVCLNIYTDPYTFNIHPSYYQIHPYNISITSLQFLSSSVLIMMARIILTVSLLMNIGYTYFKVLGSNSWPYSHSEAAVCGAGDVCWIGLRDDLNGNDDMVFEWDDHSDISTSYGFNSD